jgi:hypothetical protein
VSEQKGQPEDLELSGSDAGQIKGGQLDVGGGDNLSSGKGYKAKKKKKKKQSIGPYQGRH